MFIYDLNLRPEHIFIQKMIGLLVDGTGKSKDSAEIHADDESGVQAGHL